MEQALISIKEVMIWASSKPISKNTAQSKSRTNNAQYMNKTICISPYTILAFNCYIVSLSSPFTVPALEHLLLPKAMVNFWQHWSHAVDNFIQISDNHNYCFPFLFGPLRTFEACSCSSHCLCKIPIHCQDHSRDSSISGNVHWMKGGSVTLIS